MEVFRDRRDAGRRLARLLGHHLPAGAAPVVLAIPRGGVPVGAEVAAALEAPLDVLVVRKIGVPGQEELALGAVASGGFVVLDRELVEEVGISRDALAELVRRKLQEVAARESSYRGGRPELAIRGRTVVLVDDGVATGSSVRAAIAAVRRREPSRLIVAVPVAPPSMCRRLEALADAVVCLLEPPDFEAVGAWYVDFAQTSDEEVRHLLRQAQAAPLAPGGAA